MAPPRRALVLGGGGITGIAWEIGLLAGLAAAGIDLSCADRIVGTSAGSVTGALIASGRGLEELFAEQQRPPTGEKAAGLGLIGLLRFVLGSVLSADDQSARVRLGRWALAARTPSEVSRLDVMRSRLAGLTWTDRDLLITAVDAHSGESRVFDRQCGVPLLEAVAASCAVPLVWPPMTIQGRRYMDGGIRSVANADLATGCERVVVLAPIAASLRRSGRISNQLATLGSGVHSVVVSPDPRAQRAIGRNVLDPAFRAASAVAGRAQAASVATQVAEVWSGERINRREGGAEK